MIEVGNDSNKHESSTASDSTCVGDGVDATMRPRTEADRETGPQETAAESIDHLPVAQVEIFPSSDARYWGAAETITPFPLIETPPPIIPLPCLRQNCGFSRRWELLVAVAALAATVAVVVVVVVFVGGSSGGSSGGSNGSASNDNGESQVREPPNGMTLAEYLQNIRLELLTADAASSQLRATEWLTYEDTLFLDSSSWRLRQRYALVAVYFALGGQEGGFLSENGGWTQSGAGIDECQWTFVECDEESRVIGVVMLRRSVAVAFSGTLSSDIAMLTSLKRLGVTGNRLEGSIPNELFSLDLEYLDLSSNQFSSTISSHIGQLQHLEHLDLSNNWFSGELPSEMGLLHQIG